METNSLCLTKKRAEHLHNDAVFSQIHLSIAEQAYNLQVSETVRQVPDV